MQVTESAMEHVDSLLRLYYLLVVANHNVWPSVFRSNLPLSWLVVELTVHMLVDKHS